MEADHQLPLFWAPGIQFLFQHDISVSFGLSKAVCSLFGSAVTPCPSSLHTALSCSTLGLFRGWWPCSWPLLFHLLEDEAAAADE